MFLLRYDNTTKQVIEEVARGSQDLSVYNAANVISTSSIDVRIAFDRAYMVSNQEKYAIGWSVTGFQIGDMVMQYSATSTVDSFIRDSSDGASSSGFEWKYAAFTVSPPNPANSGGILYQMLTYDGSWTDQETNAYTQTGLGYSSLQLVSQAVDSGQVTPPLDNFPILVGRIQGLTTYGGSTIVEKPQNIANLLNYKYTFAGGWTDQGYWDTTTLDSSHYAFLYNGATPNTRSRVVRAVFESKVTFTQVLTEVCRGTASKVGVLMNGKSFMYPFGMTETVAADISPADIISTLSWLQGDISTVINRAVIKTRRSYLSAPRFFDGQEVTGYEFVTDYSAANEPRLQR